MTKILIGIDVGSSSCKVTAMDVLGQVISTGSQAYTTEYPRPGWAVQHPKDWYQAACQAVRACQASKLFHPMEVAGICVDGPAHSAALLDGKGEVVYPTIHTSDLRSDDQSQRLALQAGQQVFEISYQQPNPSWTLSHLLWLHENDYQAWKQLRMILVVKDYVRWRLTGKYLTDRYDAIGTQLFDTRKDCWSPVLCSLAGVPVEYLPDLADPFNIAGVLIPSAAKDLGLPPGIPVAVGSGDSVVEAFGVGVVKPGQAIVKLATAANANLVTAKPQPSPLLITYRHIIEPYWFSITATNFGAVSLRWFRETFLKHENTLAEYDGRNIFDLMETLAGGVPPGSEGLIFHPYLKGERTPYWDPSLRGDFMGISVRHNTAHFIRAVMEGVAFSLRDCLTALQDLGQPIDDLRLIGGGAKIKLWRQIVCDVLGRPLIKPAVEDASFGAAMLAGVAVGFFPDWLAAVNTCVRMDSTLTPDPAAQQHYSDLYSVYKGVAQDMTKHNHRLAELACRQFPR